MWKALALIAFAAIAAERIYRQLELGKQLRMLIEESRPRGPVRNGIMPVRRA